MKAFAQELIPMARKLMEEKGPITEFDVARVEKGFGDITLPLEDKLFLMDQLRAKVNQALQAKMGLAQTEGDPKYADLMQHAAPIERSGNMMEDSVQASGDDLESRKQRLRARYMKGR